MSKVSDFLENFGQQLVARLLLACAFAVVGCLFTLAMPVFFISLIVCALFGWIESFPKIKISKLLEE
jgi:hypothetical protein